LGPLCCVGEKVKSSYPSDWATTNVPRTWAGVISTISVLLGRDVPGHTPTLINNFNFDEKSLIHFRDVNKVGSRDDKNTRARGYPPRIVTTHRYLSPASSE